MMGIQANLYGTAEVEAGFGRMGSSAERMGEKISTSSKKSEVSYRSLMMTSAGLIANSVQLGDVMDRMVKGQMDVTRGAIMLGMNFLQLGGQIYMLYTHYGKLITAKITHLALSIQERAADYAAAISKGAHTIASWALTAAEHARAIAHTVANALAGPVGWAILAGAVAAAGVGIALAASIPSKQGGGLISETKPYLLHVGERLLRAGETSNSMSVVINNPVFRSQGDMDYLVDRLRRMGKA